MLSFKEEYTKNIIPSLDKAHGYTNPHRRPKLLKICINTTIKPTETKDLEVALDQLTRIAGQKAIICHAKQSNATFKIREGMPLACKVTLRGDRMYHFLERLVLVALPRLRDFRGFKKKSFDGKGNLSIGIKEQTIFPEIHYDEVDKPRGFDITIVTSSSTNAEAKTLLEGFHLPFQA